MDDTTFQEVRQTIIRNENRLRFIALQAEFELRGIVLAISDLRSKQDEGALHEVDGFWIVPDWWNSGAAPAPKVSAR